MFHNDCHIIIIVYWFIFLFMHFRARSLIHFRLRTHNALWYEPSQKVKRNNDTTVNLSASASTDLWRYINLLLLLLNISFTQCELITYSTYGVLSWKLCTYIADRRLSRQSQRRHMYRARRGKSPRVALRSLRYANMSLPESICLSISTQMTLETRIIVLI